MAISNNVCENCDHRLVCSKQTVLSKFNDEAKTFIGMDIRIEKCNDLKEAE
jgi:hypothetical protein